MSDAPSSVQHGQMQRGSVQREEVTEELPAFPAILNHLYKTYLSPRELGESPGDTDSCISHCQFLPLHSLQSLSVQVEIAAEKSWKFSVFCAWQPTPGLGGHMGKPSNETHFSLKMRNQESMAADSLDSLKHGTTAFPGCSAVGSTGCSCQDSHQILSRYFNIK